MNCEGRGQPAAREVGDELWRRLRGGGPGAPLAPALRRRMEALFGADFGEVRVHVRPEETGEIGAFAFTMGEDIYLSSAHLSEDARILGHELAHVVQQREGRAVHPSGEGVAVLDDPRLEAEAERMSRIAAMVGEAPLASAAPRARPPRPARAGAGAVIQCITVYGPDGSEHDTTDVDGFCAWVDTLTTPDNLGNLKIIYNMFLKAAPKTYDVAIAASKVQHAVDRLEPKPASSHATPLASLPRDRWWKLFIEARHHGSKNKHGGLIFDMEQSPGFYNAMMKVFVAMLLPPIDPSVVLTFTEYDRMHEAVTAGVFKLNDDRASRSKARFVPVPHEKSYFTKFPFEVQGYTTSWISLWEMAQDGDIGAYTKTLLLLAKKAGQEIPKEVLAGWYEDAFATSLLTSDMSTQLSWGTNYEQDEAPGKVNAILARYYRERARARDASGQRPAKEVSYLKVRAIARVVRALHVGHFYADANGRLNTMLLLNYLLLQEGLTPVILYDTGVFGGAANQGDLVMMVDEGMAKFREEVEDARRPRVVAQEIRCVICDRPGTRPVTCKRCSKLIGYVCDGYLCQPSLWATKPHEKPSVIPLMNVLCDQCG